MFTRFIIIVACLSFFVSETKSVFNFLIGLIGLYSLYDSTFYLPFLDTTYFPDITSPFPNTATERVEIQNLPPNTKVVYWAAKSNVNSNVLKTPLDAYKSSENKGFVLSDSDGNATLLLDCPASYIVGKIGKRELPKHVHYRYELSQFPGLYSRVFTKNLVC
jgi:hypothetical protein